LSTQELLVRDPILGFVDLGEYDFIREIVETPLFQRLRRLNQLGFSPLIYPSACHTRFSHSIGAMHIFWRLFDRLRKFIPNDIDVDGLRKTGTATVLLHDIGHGPFSHVTEPIFGFNHDDIAKDLICQPPLSDILVKAGINPSDLRKILEGTTPSKLAPLSQLVSSQLDVDRLDYLVRDAYFTGIGFGNIDLDRIISTMILYDKDPLKGQAVNLYKARFSLESYILTRHLMYQAVYLHKATRGVELVLKSIFKRAKVLKGEIEMPPELSFVSEDRSPKPEELVVLDDNLLYAQIWHWSKAKDPILSQLCNCILHRRLLKAIDIPWDKVAWMYESGLKLVNSVAKKKRFDSEYFCPLDNPVDTPYKPYSPKAPDEERSVITNIFVIDKDGGPKEISQVSDVVASLSQTQYLLRLYCPEDIREDVRKILK